MFGFQFPSISNLQYHHNEQKLSVFEIYNDAPSQKSHPNMTSIQEFVFHGWERFKQGGIQCNTLT